LKSTEYVVRETEGRERGRERECVWKDEGKRATWWTLYRRREGETGEGREGREGRREKGIVSK
jgi:hypothetical protein